MSTEDTTYNIIIIGAGPAGLSAGRTLIKKSCNDRVLLLDKIAPWEHPVPCAEGVGKLGFEENAPISPSWIRHRIVRAVFHAPNGKTITYTDKNGGYIINRAKMEKDIAEELLAAGIECDFSTKVKYVSTLQDGIRYVKTSDNKIYSAKVIIDASGPLNCFGKEEKIAVKPLDLEPACFAWVSGLDIATDQIHIFVGSKIAPGGYGWIFPREEGNANIGILLGRNYIKDCNIRKQLDEFIKNNLSSAKIIKIFAGSIPCSYQRTLPMAVPGLIKCGDAASTVNPISRAGISEAMISGRFAAETAVAMLGATSLKEMKKYAKEYEKRWHLKRGKHHNKLAKVKEIFYSIPDEDYNKAVEILSTIPQNQLTMAKIFSVSLKRFPRLIWAMRYLL